MAGICNYFYGIGNSTALATESANAIKFTPPSVVGFGAGNCGVLAITYPHGNAPTGISDTVNGAWPITPKVTASGASNDTSFFTFPNLTAGKGTFTINFASAQQPVKFEYFEIWGVATAAPENGTSSNATQTNAGSGVNAGTLTPTTTGNFVICACHFEGGGSAGGTNPTNFSPGGSFTLQMGDIACAQGQGLPAASMYLESSASSFTPTITPNGDTANPYNLVAIALKLAPGAGTQPRSFEVVKFVEQTNNNQLTTSLPLRFPVLGNCAVLMTAIKSAAIGISSVTDSDGITWTNATLASDGCQCFVRQNGSASPSLVVTVHFSTTPNQTFYCQMYDIQGASASAIGASANTVAANLGPGSVANQPSLTPQTSNGIIVAALNDGLGPVSAITAPSIAQFDIVTYTGTPAFSDSNGYGQGNGHAHGLSNSGATQSWTWTIPSLQQIASLAVEIKAGPAQAAAGQPFGVIGMASCEW